jgi:hypothetical protein
MTEMSLSIIQGVPVPGDFYQEMYVNPIDINPLKIALQLSILYPPRLSNIIETNLVKPEIFENHLEFSFENFNKIRAGLLSFADYCSCRAYTIFSLYKETKNQNLLKEYFEWVAVNFTDSYFIGTLMFITEVNEAEVSKIIKFFTLDVESKNYSDFEDGFTPTLIKVKNSYFFSPHIIRSNLITRNILYIVNKKQSDIFNNLISQHLEPSLLEKATNILSKIPGLKIKNSINWSAKDCCGEFDIAGYHPDHNIFLHVQAKAALPPQGARMTKAIERRSEEGIKQLERFYNLSEESKNTILSSKFNCKLTSSPG